MTNHYELLYLVSGTFSEDELIPIKERVKQLIEKREGKITLEDSLGKKKLAYPIKQFRHGYYLLYEFDLAGENLKSLENDLKLTPEVLRHQTVRRELQTLSFVEMTEKKVEKEKEETKEKKRPEKDKIKMQDLDEKLDEILKGDIM